MKMPPDFPVAFFTAIRREMCYNMYPGSRPDTARQEELDLEYIFKTGGYDRTGITREVMRALEKDTELESRAKMPRMWDKIDRLNESEKAPEDVLEKRKKRSRIYGVLLLILGVLLVIPGIMDPDGMMLQLIAGCIGLAAGAMCLLPARRKRSSNLQRRFERSARQLLTQLKAAPESEICFTDEGMQIADGDVVPYSAFSRIVASGSIYLLVWSGNTTLIQKQNLAEGEPEDFDAFLRSHIAVVDAPAD